MLLPLLFAMPPEPAPTWQPPADEVVSVHSDALRAHRHEPRVPRAFPHNGSQRSSVKRIVYGYLPYWVSDTSQIQWDLLTHVADFSMDLNSDGTLGDKNGWPDQALVTAAHAAGVKVEPVFTLFSSTSLGTLLNSKANRTTAIKNMVDQMEAGGADGVSLDFEGVPSAAKAGLTAFCQELRAELTARGHADAGISIAAPAVDWSGAFDIPVLLDSIDVYFIMGYDYFWSGSSMAGPSGIFRTNDAWLPAASWTGLRSVARTAQLAGEAKRKKVVYGVPYYGREYTTAGQSWPSTVNSNVGAKTYSVAREMLQSGTPKVFDDNICQPAMIWQESGVWHQLWYEDAASLQCKYDLVLQQDIGGTGMWALGSDNGYPDLWKLLEDNFTAPAKLGEGSRDAPIAMTSFPYQDSRDTSKGGFRYFNYYGCKDTLDEYGREFVYQLDTCQKGTVHLQVDAVGGDDPDVHLLSDRKEGACIARADVTIDQAVEAGRYYVVIDTYVSGNVEQEGQYTVHADFTADPAAQGCPAGTTCEAGECVCPGGQTLCAAACKATLTDPSNCGACGAACAAGQACAGGTCASGDAGAEAEAAAPHEAGADGPLADAAGDGAGEQTWTAPQQGGCDCSTGPKSRAVSRLWWALGAVFLALWGRKPTRDR
jgi:MYXO-CTERM domain-containing protein